MLLAKTNNQQAGVRKHTLARPVRFGQVSLKFMVVGLFAALALLYLAQSTQSAGRSYQMRALDEERKQLQIESDRLRVESVRLRALDTLQKDFTTAPAPDGAASLWQPIQTTAFVKTADVVAERQP